MRARFSRPGVVSLPGLDFLAAEVTLSGSKYNVIARRQTRDDFYPSLAGGTQRDVAEGDEAVRSNHVHALHLPTFHHRGRWDDQCVTLTSGKLGTAKESRAQLRISRKFDFYREAAACGIRGWNNLHDLAPQSRGTQRINPHWNRLSHVRQREVLLVEFGFQAEASAGLNRQDRHSRRSQRSRIHAPLGHHSVERSSNPRIFQRGL